MATYSTRNFLQCFTLALALVIMVVPQARAVDVPLQLDLPRPGLAANLVNKAWMSDPEYNFWTKDSGMVPSYFIAMADINGDSTPEIFARHDDPYLGFCNVEGKICRMHIYAYTSKGFFEIGRMPTTLNIFISSERTQNISNIIVEVENGKRVTYVWNGAKYEAKK